MLAVVDVDPVADRFNATAIYDDLESPLDRDVVEFYLRPWACLLAAINPAGQFVVCVPEWLRCG